MPHIEGLGSIDWNFQVGNPWTVIMELDGYGYLPINAKSNHHSPFVYYPTKEGEGFTCVQLSFSPDAPVGKGFSLGTVGYHVSVAWWHDDDRNHELPKTLEVFRSLSELTQDEYGHISFVRTENNILVYFDIPGRINSPEGLMRGIVRRLRAAVKSKMSKPMTPENQRWGEFIEKLAGPQGCNFREAGKNAQWECDGNFSRATKILTEMGNVNVKESLKFFRARVWHCDCEIVLNGCQ